MSYDIMKAAEICKATIESRHLTVTEVSKMSGLSVMTIKRFLSGNTTNPNARTLGKLFDALGLKARETL